MSRENTMIDAWERVLSRKADDIALVEAAQKRNYRFQDLNDLVDEWLKRFEGKKIAHTSVIVHLPNGANWIALLIALRRTNAVIVPVDFSWPLQKVEEVAEQFRAVLTITSSGVNECDLPHRKWKEDCAFVKLTSGSTGAPKGIVFCDDELIADGSNIIETMGLVEDDRNLCLHPLGHSYALGNVVMPLLAYGIPVVIGSSPFPRVIIEEAMAFGVTILPTVPAILEALCKAGAESLGPIRLVISAAARLTPELANAFLGKFGLCIHNFYGSSETGGIAYDRSGKFGLNGDTLGTALANVKLRTSKQGHLIVQSLAVSHYGKSIDRDEPAGQVLSDLVEIAVDGSVVLRGRADRVEKIAGNRIDLEATERELIKVFSVPCAAIFKIGDVIEVVVEGGLLDECAIRHWLARRLGRRYRLSSMDEIPLTARGKIDQASLKAHIISAC